MTSHLRMCLCAWLWASQCGPDTNIQHTTHAIIFNWFILFDSLVNLYSPLYLNFFPPKPFRNTEFYNCSVAFRRTHITHTHAHAHSWDFLKCVCCSMASISILPVISRMGYCVVYMWEWPRVIKHILINWVQGTKPGMACVRCVWPLCRSHVNGCNKNHRFINELKLNEFIDDDLHTHTSVYWFDILRALVNWKQFTVRNVFAVRSFVSIVVDKIN